MNLIKKGRVIKSIVIFCASSEGNDPLFFTMAKEVGKLLAIKGITIVFGGSKLGLMGAVAEGSLTHNGKVIGVIPDFLCRKEVVHSGLTELIVVKTMHERKSIMNDHSDAVIILPGGYGTMDELFEMLTWGQLGLHNKPIGILNINGFYNELITFMDNMVAKKLLKKENRDMLLVSENIEELLELMHNYEPQHTLKWITKELI